MQFFEKFCSFTKKKRRNRVADGRVLHCQIDPDYNQLIMDIFIAQIVAAIRKIRTQKERPDSDKILNEVVKESATNIRLEDIQQALKQMVSDDKMIDTLHKSLDSY